MKESRDRQLPSQRRRSAKTKRAVPLEDLSQWGTENFPRGVKLRFGPGTKLAGWSVDFAAGVQVRGLSTHSEAGSQSVFLKESSGIFPNGGDWGRRRSPLGCSCHFVACEEGKKKKKKATVFFVLRLDLRTLGWGLTNCVLRQNSCRSTLARFVPGAASLICSVWVFFFFFCSLVPNCVAAAGLWSPPAKID